MRTRIIIDSQDADEAPEAPFTLNVYRDDDDGAESRESIDIGQEGSCLVGRDIPAMLRQLADEWEREPLDAIDRAALDVQIEAAYQMRLRPDLPLVIGRSGVAMIAAREENR